MTENGIWVFGYGSLIWDPGFAHTERQVARLGGYCRSFCMRSVHHRGTAETPGLVLALDRMPGGVCTGVAFRVAPALVAETLKTLRARELITSAYLEAELLVRLKDGRQVRAVTYVIDPDHAQYCGQLPLETQARIIARAVGGRGPNTEYLYNTADHLSELGLEDPDLAWLARRVRVLTG